MALSSTGWQEIDSVVDLPLRSSRRLRQQRAVAAPSLHLQRLPQAAARFDAPGRPAYPLPMKHPLPALARFALLLACLAAAAPAAAQAQRGAQARGLWIGSIPACAGTVADVAVAPDYSGERSAIITVLPAWRAALLRETTRLLNRPMPVRLDGRVLMSPFVREPIVGGVVALGPVTARQAERIGRAAARPCPRSRR
jgi:hypothetical protein